MNIGPVSPRARPRPSSILFVLLPSLAAVGAGAASFLGRLWWPFDLLSSFRPHLTVGLIAAALVLFGARWRRSALAVALLALGSAATIAPLFIAPEAPDTSGSPSFRVITFNVQGSNARFHEVVDWVLQQDADVVVLHEATFDWTDAFEAAGGPLEIVPGWSPGRDFGTLALVPPGASVESYGFRITDPRAVEIGFDVDGTPIRLLSVHPLSPGGPNRNEVRDRHLDFAAEWAAALDGVRTVVAGDFNATPWSHAFRAVQRRGDLENSQRGYGLELSFPTTASWLLQVPIDHVLYSEGLAVVDRRLGPELGSDHVPVIVDLAVTP